MISTQAFFSQLPRVGDVSRKEEIEGRAALKLSEEITGRTVGDIVLGRRILSLKLLYQVIQCEIQISCCSNRKPARRRFLSISAGGECGQGCCNYPCQRQAARYIDKAVSKIHELYPKLRFLPVQVDLFVRISRQTEILV